MTAQALLIIIGIYTIVALAILIYFTNEFRCKSCKTCLYEFSSPLDKPCTGCLAKRNKNGELIYANWVSKKIPQLKKKTNYPIRNR